MAEAAPSLGSRSGRRRSIRSGRRRSIRARVQRPSSSRRGVAAGCGLSYIRRRRGVTPKRPSVPHTLSAEARGDREARRPSRATPIHGRGRDRSNRDANPWPRQRWFESRRQSMAEAEIVRIATPINNGRGRDCSNRDANQQWPRQRSIESRRRHGVCQRGRPLRNATPCAAPRSFASPPRRRGTAQTPQRNGT